MSNLIAILQRHVTPGLAFFLMVVMMQPHVYTLVAQELRISSNLAMQVTVFTGSLYVAIYLLGEAMRALVITRQYRDGIAIGAMFIGVLAGSLQVAIGLVLLASILDRAYGYWSERQAGPGADHVPDHP